MKHSLELLKADILDELKQLERLEHEFSRVEHLLEKSAQEVPFYDRAAIGFYLHSFYNGCENIFRSIARFFENDMEPDTWHTDLLKRMKLVISDFRPFVIDEELFTLLDDFRAFRHKFRHSYSFDLDWDKERLVAQKFHPVFALLRTQVASFLKKLEDIEV